MSIRDKLAAMPKMPEWSGAYTYEHEYREHVERETAALRARLDVALEAVESLAMFFSQDGGTANERFERVAAAYYRDTGMLAPGKDAAMCEDFTPEQRREAYAQWVSARVADARAVLEACKV